MIKTAMNFLAQKLGLTNMAEPWIAQILMILIATFIVQSIVSLVLRLAEKLAKKTNSDWDDALIGSARRPVFVALWLIGLTYAAGMARGQYEDTDEFFNGIGAARDIGLLICVGWALIRFTRYMTKNVIASREAKGEEIDYTTVDALGKLARLTILVSVTLVGLQMTGISITGLLTMGGIGGIAVGFAAKDLLANFFGGLTIYLDRPFSVGDWIRSPDKAIEGSVEYISWRHTRIRAFNKNPIYVPNALFTTIVVENPSRMSHRRIKETIGLRYDDLSKVAVIVADIKLMLQNHPEVDAKQTLIVNFNAFAESSLDIFIYTFTKTTVWVHYHEIKQDIFLKIANIIEAHGAEIAFPTRTLHMVNQSE